MPELMDNLVVESLLDALERMAFVGVSPADPPIAEPGRPLRVAITFGRPSRLRIELLAGEGFGTMLAANVMATGEDDPDAQSRARDALSELLNITCGNMLLRQPPQGSMGLEMRLPTVEALAPGQWDQLLADGTFVPLDADGHPIALRIIEQD